jgi:hypothetical protein
MTVYTEMYYACVLALETRRLGSCVLAPEMYYAPGYKLHFKCIFKMLKLLKTKFSGDILKLYTLTNWFHRKPTF